MVYYFEEEHNIINYVIIIITIAHINNSTNL